MHQLELKGSTKNLSFSNLQSTMESTCNSVLLLALFCVSLTDATNLLKIRLMTFTGNEVNTDTRMVHALRHTYPELKVSNARGNPVSKNVDLEESGYIVPYAAKTLFESKDWFHEDIELNEETIKALVSEENSFIDIENPETASDLNEMQVDRLLSKFVNTEKLHQVYNGISIESWLNTLSDDTKISNAGPRIAIFSKEGFEKRDWYMIAYELVKDDEEQNYEIRNPQHSTHCKKDTNCEQQTSPIVNVPRIVVTVVR